MTIVLSDIQTIALAVLLLVVGRIIKNHVAVLQKLAIPEPVISGFLFAIFNFIMTYNEVWTLEFDTSFQEFWMIVFFTTVAFNASMDTLKKGGPMVGKFLLCAVILVVLQNFVPILLTKLGLVDVHPLIALMTGSVSMTGGHGTSAGIAPQVEAAGISGAEAAAYASATFGLIIGSLTGGPTGSHLIDKYDLKADQGQDQKVDLSVLKKKKGKKVELNKERLLKAFTIILVTMGIGSLVNIPLNKLVHKATELASFPPYIGALLVGIVMRAHSDHHGDWVPNEEVQALGNIGLNIFLSMALMTLNIMDLTELAGSLLILLAFQTLLILVYPRFVAFNMMGKDYDAAVLSGGLCGFAMGATPNGVANMTSICQKYEYSTMPFFVLPIVGGMFIDLVNVFLIIIAMTLVG